MEGSFKFYGSTKCVISTLTESTTKISTVFGGLAIIPCLISAYNLKGPNGGGEQIPLWDDLNSNTALPLLVTTCIGWIWTICLIGFTYVALADPFTLKNKERERDFKTWWRFCTYDTYGPIYIDILTCLFGWCAAAVSIFFSRSTTLVYPWIRRSHQKGYFTNCIGDLVFDIFSDSTGSVFSPGIKYHDLSGMWAYIHVLVFYPYCHSARSCMYATTILPDQAMEESPGGDDRNTRMRDSVLGHGSQPCRNEQGGKCSTLERSPG